MSRLGWLLIALLALGPRAAAQDASGGFETPDRPVWAGEVFDLTLSWRVDWSRFSHLEGPLSWTSAPLVAEPWGEPARVEAPGRAAAIQLRTRALALKPGRVALSPARQTMVLQTGVSQAGDVAVAITQPVEVVGAPADLVVRALPPAPPDFLGAVGEFDLESRLSATKVQVGEPVTWTVTLSGVGNWPAIRGFPTRQASRDFDVTGRPKLIEDKNGELFERTLGEEVVLIPRRAGAYVLSAVEMTVFDPRAGRYVAVRAPPVRLEVEGDPGSPVAPATPAATAGAGDLPRLISPRSPASAPMPETPFRTLLWLFGLAVPAAWTGLALGRAWSADPERIARGAHRRGAAALDRLGQADGAAARRLVRQWQVETGLRLKLGRAAPTPAAFAHRPDWRDLWIEADRFLYGPPAPLPEDWLVRARGLWADLPRPPGFRPSSALARRHLFPGVFVLALLIALPGEPLAADPTEASLRGRLAERPLDWAARHDLAVLLAARDRKEEAAAQAAAAWLQQPAARETRDLWSRSAEAAGYADAARGGPPRPAGWRGELMSLTSPAAWRWWTLAFGGATAAGAILALLRRYGHAGRRAWLGGLWLTAAAAPAAMLCAVALTGFGAALDRNAVVVWNPGPFRALPLEAAGAEEPALPPGQLARAERRFLSWRRVEFQDGRRGWVRERHLVWVWR